MKIDCVLDTSALCAYHLGETGYDAVAPYMEAGSRAMHIVNAAEFCYTMPKRGPGRFAPRDAWNLLLRDGVDRAALFDPPFLWLAADIRLAAPALSVGDGFAVAPASVADAPVVTADKAFLRAADYARILLIR